MKLIAITTGDPDGVGLEVTLKALRKISVSSQVAFFIWRQGNKPLSSVRKKFQLIVVNDSFFNDLACSRDQLLLLIRKNRGRHRQPLIFDIQSQKLAPLWFQEAARLCRDKILDGVVTGPLSKTLIQKSGLSDIGHTEILERICQTRDLYQGYLGPKFNVVLISAHVSLKKVPSLLTQKRLEQAFRAAKELVSYLPLSRRRKPLALLGVNPHAGEKGLLGSDESRLLRKFCRSKKMIGPLSPDAAFLPQNWKKFSCYLACYHDQGLIPFKLVHGQNSGLQVTLGLPFLRTSVDHGTAKDIFGQNKANPNSMMDALKMALKMC